LEWYLMLNCPWYHTNPCGDDTQILILFDANLLHQNGAVAGEWCLDIIDIGHEDANMEEDVGDGNEQDDLELVHSATSTHHGSDDDDMQGWEGRKDLKAHSFYWYIIKLSVNSYLLIYLLYAFSFATLNNILFRLFVSF
jgi:hypothetical protein